MARARSQIVVLIVDDHPVMVSGCSAVLAVNPSIRVIAARDVQSGFEAYLSKKPDVSIIDINLPDLSGFELLRRIKREDADAAVIMLSMNDDPAFVLRAVDLGAAGYVSKSDDPKHILSAVEAVSVGEKFISPQLAKSVTFASASIRSNPSARLSSRELEILRLLARGSKIDEAARSLDISYKTVANTTSLMKQKLGAKNHSDLIRLAIEMGLGN
jgi:DNA-binding NarL/FixJ family response regulator